MSDRSSQEADRRPDGWAWPVDLSAYDARGELSVPETEALDEAVGGLDSRDRYRVREALKGLNRLLAPLDDAFETMDANPNIRGLARNSLLREMHRRGSAYWAWDRDEWLRTLKGDNPGSGPGKPWVRRQMMAAAYLLCGYDDLLAVGQFLPVGFAAKVFGPDLLDAASERVREELVAWGCGSLPLGEELDKVIARVLLANRSPYLEDLTTEKLRDALERHVAPYRKNVLVTVSRALAHQGLIAAPVFPQKRASPRHEDEGLADGCPEEWASWCERWRDTCTLAEVTRRARYGHLIQAGRWLARNHPDVTSPEQWTRSLAAEYVAAAQRLTIGEWSEDNEMCRRGEVGQPLAAQSKAHRLTVMSTFFRDLQEWGWVPRRFDPRRTFAVPRTLKAQIVTDPRPIADEVWAKLLWAGLNLSEEDLPNSQWAPGSRTEKALPYYPLAMVRAVTVVWLFAGLRNDEIRRLRVGCVRWQRDEAAVHGADGQTLPKDAVCWLDVPVNKTGGAFTKPVDRAVGEAIEAWEKVRPRQPADVDPKTAETVHYLFHRWGKRLGVGYINKCLIPLLCRKAGIPKSDARGNITSHRARSTIATQLFNAKEPMGLFELQEWLGHGSPASTRHYAKIAPTRLAKSYSDAGYFGRNLRAIEVLVDGEAVRSGGTANGDPWKFYDLGHGYCTYDFYSQCPHRMACARCSFYVPKDSMRAQLLEGKTNLSRMREEIPLTDEEVAAVEEGIGLHDKLLDCLSDVPTPAGPTPRQLGLVPLSSKPSPKRPPDST